MPTDPERPVAATWAAWLDAVRFEDLPPDVVHRMKRSLLDAVGGTIFGATEPVSRSVVEFVTQQGSRPEATVFPDGVRTSGPHAALALATFMQAADLSESFTRATMLVGNIVPPVAVAEAERLGRSGRDLLTALAVGYEIGIRCGLASRIDPASPTMAARPAAQATMGLAHPVATYGLSGATAAAAKLLRLDPVRAGHAFTLGAATWPTVGTTMRPRPDGRGMADEGTVKDLFVGWSVAHGATAAHLAAVGITGPLDVLGRFRDLVPDASPEVLVRGLGTDYLVSAGGLHFKWHRAAGLPQSAAAATLAVLEHAEVQPEDVARIVVTTTHRGVRISADVDPPSAVAAKLSIPYVVSALICYREDVAADPHFTRLFTEEKHGDERRRALARRVEVVGDDDLDRGFEVEWPMRFEARVTIELADGEVLDGRADIWPEGSQMSDEQVIAKFDHLAGPTLGADLDRVVDTLMGLEEVERLDDLIRALCPSRDGAPG